MVGIFFMGWRLSFFELFRVFGVLFVCGRWVFLGAF